MFQHVSLTSDDSETEPCGEQLPMELDDGLPPGGFPHGSFPADTPVTPPAIGIQVLGEVLPGDGSGRGSF